MAGHRVHGRDRVGGKEAAGRDPGHCRPAQGGRGPCQGTPCRTVCARQAGQVPAILPRLFCLAAQIVATALCHTDAFTLDGDGRRIERLASMLCGLRACSTQPICQCGRPRGLVPLHFGP